MTITLHEGATYRAPAGLLVARRDLLGGGWRLDDATTGAPRYREQDTSPGTLAALVEQGGHYTTAQGDDLRFDDLALVELGDRYTLQAEQGSPATVARNVAALLTLDRTGRDFAPLPGAALYVLQQIRGGRLRMIEHIAAHNDQDAIDQSNEAIRRWAAQGGDLRSLAPGISNPPQAAAPCAQCGAAAGAPEVERAAGGRYTVSIRCAGACGAVERAADRVLAWAWYSALQRWTPARPVF